MAAAVTLRRVRASNGRARVERMVHHRVRCHNFTSMKLRRTRATRYSYSRLFVLGDVASAGEPLPVERLVSAGLRLEVR